MESQPVDHTYWSRGSVFQSGIAKAIILLSAVGYVLIILAGNADENRLVRTNPWAARSPCIIRKAESTLENWVGSMPEPVHLKGNNGNVAGIIKLVMREDGNQFW